MKLYKKFQPIIQIIKKSPFTNTWKKIPSSDILIVCHDAHRGLTYKGKSYSPLLDSICDLGTNKGYKISSIALCPSRLHGAKAYNNPYTYNFTLLYIYLISFLVRRFKSAEYTTKWIIKKHTNLWIEILKQASPKIVIAIQPQPELCRAGKSTNVKIYDLQHGVIAKEHPWYGEKYKKLLDPVDLPDGFLCWDQESASVIQKWAGYKNIEVKVIGNPWFLRFKYPSKKDYLVQDYINTNKLFASERPSILITLQWGIKKKCYKNAENFNLVMLNDLEQLIFETEEKYNWMIRLHPIQWVGSHPDEKFTAKNYIRNKFDELAHVEWKRSSTLPLPAILSQTSIHITDCSTVVKEAGWMGVKSAILNQEIRKGGKLESYFEKEISCGVAEVLHNSKESISNWIEKNIESRDSVTITMDNAEKLNRFIDNIKKL